ncbi:hypothetical protein [Nocardia sp. CC227C]|uniref:DUF7373 family lipoprotein n=1 Tax=Nocardia sp. CC227C TaxID=3044562 RepID=UPI00278C0A37|nr:hypothetical protein [Nocardia sp. CC227C]
MRFRFHRIAAVALAAIAACAAAGCGGGDGSTADSIAATDFGPYSPTPTAHSYDSGPNRTRGRIVESLRLGEHIVFGSDIDPAVASQRYANSIVDEHGMWSGVQAHQMMAAAPFNPYAGFMSESAETPYLGEHLKHPAVKVVLTAFPDDQSAAAAAAAMSSSDFALNDANTPVALPGYPAALSHWIPTYADIGSWMAYRSVVIHVLVQAREPNLDRMTALLSTAYREQVRRLENFEPVPPADLDTLPLDPGGLLARLVSTGDSRPDARRFAVYDPRTYALLTSTDPAEPAREYKARGVSAIAVSDNKYLFELPDAAAAENFAGYLAESPTVSKYVEMAGVRGVDDISCFQATAPNRTESQARRYRCLVRHDNLIAEVFSHEDRDVRHLAAAQHALLKDSE